MNLENTQVQMRKGILELMGRKIKAEVEADGKGIFLARAVMASAHGLAQKRDKEKGR